MKEIIAYTICSDQFLQRLFAFCGAGMNGKGTFLKLLTKFIGTKNYCASDIKVLSNNNFESSALYKKLACIMGEVDASDLTNTNTIKKLSGEDDMRFEFKGKGSFTEESITTCLIATNSMPTTPDKSMGFYRRWLIIDFPHQFSVKRDLIGQIPDQEFENLGRCCLNLLKEMQETNQITNEGNLKQREERFEERSNPVMKFIETNCEEDFNGKTEFREFCNCFNNYLKSKHLRIQSPILIGKMLRTEGFEVAPRKIMRGADVISSKFVIGLIIKTTTTTQTTAFSSQKSYSKTSSDLGSSGSSGSSTDKKEWYNL
jgi:putative DNA primase/helicase